MKAVFAVLALVAVAQGQLLAAGPVLAGQTVIARAPALDSAVIKSDRIGGNFAYSVAESHAYAAHTPIIQNVVRPVAVTHSVPTVVAAPGLAAPLVRSVVAAPALTTIAGLPAGTVRIA